MAGSDNFESMDASLMANFDRKNNSIIKEVDRLSKEQANLERELQSLLDSEVNNLIYLQNPLTIVERERAILLSDKEKFQNYLNHIQSKRDNYIKNLAKLKEDLTVSEVTLTQLYSEKQELTKVVDSQELSPADVDRMNATRDQLATSLATCRENLDNINQSVWKSEIAVQKNMDMLEKKVQEFSNRNV